LGFVSRSILKKSGGAIEGSGKITKGFKLMKKGKKLGENLLITLNK